jgi:hypothetical protein
MSIQKKLLEFQKLNISVKKDGKNPHFKSKYATLNEVLDKVKQPLNNLGVVIIFTPNFDGLETTLFDTESETSITSYMKYIGATNAQQILSCNTYYRRGSLISLLGLEDEDDDGNLASAIDYIYLLNNCQTLEELKSVYASIPNPTPQQINLKDTLKLKLK